MKQPAAANPHTSREWCYGRAMTDEPQETASNLRVRELRIAGLRTLADVRLPLDGLTVLIGDNGSGKSSILEACEILRRAASEDFPRELATVHGGVRALLRHGAGRLALGVRLSSASRDYQYSIVLGPEGTVESESLVDVGGKPEVVFDRRPARGERHNTHLHVFVRGEDGTETEHHVEGDYLGLTLFGRVSGNHAIQAVREALRRIDVQFPFDATARWAQRSRGLSSNLRDPTVIEQADGLERFGANLANVFQALKNDYSENHWQETMALVRMGLGQQIESINTRPDASGGFISLRLKYRGIDEQVPAFSLSDGMLAYLCWVALYRTSDQSLLAFDEPEVHLHPELLARVVGFLEAIAEKRPVLIATHSDRLLDCLSEPARSVVLCEIDNELATRLVRPDAERLAEWLRDYRGLGDIRGAGHAQSVLTRHDVT